MIRSHRSSVRSNETHSSSYSINRKEKCKNFCRKTIAFMVSQVGVGGLIVAYALIGAASFISIETDAKASNISYIDEVKRKRDKCATELWALAIKNNAQDANETVWRADMNLKLLEFQNYLVTVIKKGYDGRSIEQIWSFPASLMFCLSVFSMIGYGNLTPRTEYGKVTTVVYATFGIPLYILYFLNIGKVLANTFRWFYRWIHNFQEDVPMHRKKIIVPSTACLWLMLCYILLGSTMFSYLEDWNFLNAVYFSVTSLCKIGIGDFVPGTSTNATIPFIRLSSDDAQSENHTKLIINFVYILLGMGLVAMCYNLMREDIRVKIKEMTEDLELCMEDLRLRLTRCCSANHSDRELSLT